ncbi:hypothetical protein KAU43_02755 [candidate division WOR-3 bacterium]|jgi:hypothetical protein|nr:hypothetical protein [candidate division WOR-3 bacterium]
MEDILNKLETISEVLGAVVVRSDDGTRISSIKSEATNELDDVSAFIGSCGDVIAKLLKIGEFKFIEFYSETKSYLILPVEGNYLGIVSGKNEDLKSLYNIIKKTLHKEHIEENENVKETENEEKKEEVSAIDVSPNINKFIENKILQINYLIEEFSEGSAKDDWLHNVSYSLSKLDSENKMKEAIKEENDKITLYLENIKKDITEIEISTISKGIIDELCKLAVRRYGTDQTKLKIQNVIKEITKSKVG